MDIFVSVLKYIFVVGAGVEALLILRALVNLARDKARMDQPLAGPVEE